jgi:hypothetical protein
MFIESRIKWARHVAGTQEMRNLYKILGQKPGMKRPLVRPRHRLQGNIKMGLRNRM